MNQTDLRTATELAPGTIRQLTSGAMAERIDRGTAEKILLVLGCQFYDLWSVIWSDRQVQSNTSMTAVLHFDCQLKNLLEDRAMNQTQLRSVSGLSPNTVRLLTSGVMPERIDRGTAEKIMLALDCEFTDLWHIY